MDRYARAGLTNLTRADKADRIEAYLQSQGIATAGVGVRWDDETNTATVVVTADRDPSAALAAYTPTPTAQEVFRANAITDAKPVIATIAAKARADRTPVERALLGLAVAVRELTEP